jgi:hypothetical protein
MGNCLVIGMPSLGYTSEERGENEIHRSDLVEREVTAVDHNNSVLHQQGPWFTCVLRSEPREHIIGPFLCLHTGDVALTQV